MHRHRRTESASAGPAARRSGLLLAVGLSLLAVGCGERRELTDAEIERISDRVYEKLYPRITLLLEQQNAYGRPAPAATPTEPATSPALAAPPAAVPAARAPRRDSPVVVEVEG